MRHNLMFPIIPSTLTMMSTLMSGASLRSICFMAAEGEGDAGGGSGGADGGGAGAPAGDQGSGAAGDAAGGEGGGAGADAGGAAAGGAAPETIIGEAAAASADGDDKGAGAEDEGGEKEGADPEKKEGEEGGDPPLEVLGAPEKYELTVSPELAEAGMTFDKEAFDAIEPDLREMNLSNDAAQRLVNLYAGKVLPLIEKRGAERMDAVGVDMRKAWSDEARADPEIGGPKFEESKALTKQTLIKFGVPADGPFLKLLEESGLGSHPDMLRFFTNVGRATGEAAVDLGGKGKGGATRLADRVYGAPVPRTE